MVIIWIMLIIAILAVLFITKLSHLKHKISTSIIIIAALFIISTFMIVAKTNAINPWSFGGFFSGLKTYFFWLGHLFDNLRVITGNAIRMDWFAVK